MGDRKISDTPKFGECGKIPEGKTGTHFHAEGIKTLPKHACLNQGSKKNLTNISYSYILKYISKIRQILNLICNQYAADGNMQFSHASFLQAHPGH